MYVADRVINFKNGKMVSFERPSFIKEYIITIKNGKIINKERVDASEHTANNFFSRIVDMITFRNIVSVAAIAAGVAIVALGTGEGIFISILGAAYMFTKSPDVN